MAAALAALVTLALIVPAGPTAEREKQLGSEDPASLLHESIAHAEALQGASLAMRQTVDWTISFVDGLYGYLDRFEEQLATAQAELRSKLKGSLAAQFANLYPLQDELDALERLFQEFKAHDELPALTESAYDAACDMADGLGLLRTKLQAIADELARSPFTE